MGVGIVNQKGKGKDVKPRKLMREGGEGCKQGGGEMMKERVVELAEEERGNQTNSRLTLLLICFCLRHFIYVVVTLSSISSLFG
jgi:hypothetical protein